MIIKTTNNLGFMIETVREIVQDILTRECIKYHEICSTGFFYADDIFVYSSFGTSCIIVFCDSYAIIKKHIADFSGAVTIYYCDHNLFDSVLKCVKGTLGLDHK